MMMARWVFKIFGISILTSLILITYSCLCYSHLLPDEASIVVNCSTDTVPAILQLPSNINAPKNLEKEILIVLNRYPEIANSENKISFIRKNIATTIASRKLLLNVAHSGSVTFAVII